MVEAKFDEREGVAEDEGEDERYEYGRTGWDVISGVGGWFKKWYRWLIVGFVALICLVYVGWYSWTAFILGLVFFFVLAKYVIKGEYVVVDIFDDDFNFDTLLIGKRRFAKLYKKGGLAKVQTSSGVPRYICEGIDLEKGELKSSWVASISSLAFLVDMTAHKRLLNWLEMVVDKFLIKIGYSTIVGKLKAAEVLLNEFDDLDMKYAQLDQKYKDMPEALHQELGIDVEDKADVKESGDWKAVRE